MRDRAGHLQSLQKKLFGDKKRGGGPKGNRAGLLANWAGAELFLRGSGEGASGRSPGRRRRKGGLWLAGGLAKGRGGCGGRADVMSGGRGGGPPRAQRRVLPDGRRARARVAETRAAPRPARSPSPPLPPPGLNASPRSGDAGSSGVPLPPHLPRRAAAGRAGPAPGRRRREKRGNRAGGTGIRAGRTAAAGGSVSESVP